MFEKVFIASLILALSATAARAQNTNSSTTARPRPTSTNTNKSVTAPKPAMTPQKATDTQGPTATASKPRPVETKPKVAATEAPGSAAVIAAFNALLDGIRHANVKAVSGTYLNSSRLLLFNNNGTVTKGWEQMRKNRESSYPDMKDVKLEVKDVQITMLGRDGAVVTSLWTQSQTYKDVPETASGRMTLVFKRVGKEWKAVHLHTSPDKQDPARILPSEQTPSPTPSPTPHFD